jgi:hypothetical protein
MTSKFEQLIEYVINDEEAKAKELFHEIVVEKSREIYENLMTEEEDEELDEAAEEELDEAESTHDEDEKAEKAGKKVTKDIEYDDKKDRMNEEEEEMDESMHGMSEMGGDAADDLIDDVEAEEEGMEMAEGDGEEGLEDRVVDLEDKLDELMAEFESLMGGDEGEMDGEMDGDEEIDVELDSEEGGDALEMDDTEEFQSEPMPMEEAVNLSAAPKPVTSEEGGINTKSVNANNSGSKGAMAHPVKMTGDTAQGRPAPGTKELIGKVQNSVGGKKSMSPAPKPVTAQASGVNTKTPFPKA